MADSSASDIRIREETQTKYNSPTLVITACWRRCFHSLALLFVVPLATASSMNFSHKSRCLRKGKRSKKTSKSIVNFDNHRLRCFLNPGTDDALKLAFRICALRLPRRGLVEPSLCLAPLPSPSSPTVGDSPTVGECGGGDDSTKATFLGELPSPRPQKLPLPTPTPPLPLPPPHSRPP